MIVNDSSSFQRNGVLRFQAYRATSELSRLSKRRETPRGPLLMSRKEKIKPFSISSALWNMAVRAKSTIGNQKPSGMPGRIEHAADYAKISCK